MAALLVGVGIMGFFASLLLAYAMRPNRIRERLGRRALAKWWAGSLAIAVGGAGLAVLFGWPACLLGRCIAPWLLGESKGVVGTMCAIIFGLGGALLTGAGSLPWGDRFEVPLRRRRPRPPRRKSRLP